MVGVGVQNDIVVVPEPVTDKRRIRRGDLEVEATHAEAVAVAAAKPPNVLRANWLGKTSVLPRKIQVIAWVVASRLVSDPLVVGCVDMRRFWMSGLIASRGGSRGRGLTDGRRAALWNVSTADALFATCRRGRLPGLAASLLRRDGD